MKKFFLSALVLFCIVTIGVMAEEIDWSRAPGSNPSNINSDLESGLQLLGEQTNTKIIPNQGYRSTQEQRDIGDRMIQENPGYYRDTGGTVRDSQGQAKVAAPGSPYSRHESGDAVDLNRNGEGQQYYTTEELNKAGLTNTTVPSEPWHITVDPNFNGN
jgi:hypothetical protein